MRKAATKQPAIGIAIKILAPKPSRVEVMAKARRDKGKNVEITAKTLHLKDLEYNDIMAAIVENQKINKPILTIEGPGGSFETHQDGPPAEPTPPILLAELDIYHMRKEYGDEEVIRLNIQPLKAPIPESILILKKDGDDTGVVEVESPYKESHKESAHSKKQMTYNLSFILKLLW